MRNTNQAVRRSIFPLQFWWPSSDRREILITTLEIGPSGVGYSGPPGPPGE